VLSLNNELEHQNQTFNLLQSKMNLVLCRCVLFYSSFVCISAHANVYFKITIIKQNKKIILIAGVPKSQALPGFLITAPPSVCVPAVPGALAVRIQNPKKKIKDLETSRRISTDQTKGL